jgi:hypothetical protein
MPAPNVVFDTHNMDLRNNVSFFATLPTAPEDVVWSVSVGAVVVPGTQLGRFVWPDQPESNVVICAPEGCRGVVTEQPDDVQFDALARAAQVLLQLGPGGAQ